MKQSKKNAFTLIELIATLVIMAIIALIVTPLVMNIIRSARTSADKRSIDAYGRSIELAIAGYLLDNGKFPTEVSQLTIEYSGNQVVCETTQINTDSSVYLAGCTVDGRSTGDYKYGKEEVIIYDAYEVGDMVTYNNVDYYVIKNSSTSESSVTMLKSEPLTIDEVSQYGVGHINRYTLDSRGTVFDIYGYGGMAYYTSDTCGYPNSGEDNYVGTGCTTDYTQSDVKYVVDAWKAAKAPTVSEARLITFNELLNLGYELFDNGSVSFWQKTESTPDWLYNSNYTYWSMSPYNDSLSSVWAVGKIERGVGAMIVSYCYDYHHGVGTGVVRPVIVLPKSALSS